MFKLKHILIPCCWLIIVNQSRGEDFPAANLDYVKAALSRRACFLGNNAPGGTGANMEYLLKTIDLCNNGATNYGTTAQATNAWANTNAVDWCAKNMVAFPYVDSGLATYLDARNVSGNVWNDNSGRGNNFTLVNAVAVSDGLDFSQSSKGYAKSASTFTMVGLSAVTIEIRFKALAPYANTMLWEYTGNWNSSAGGFGVAINEISSSYTPNMIHTNQYPAKPVNYPGQSVEDAQFHTATMTLSSVVNPTGRLFYYDGALVNGGSIHPGNPNYYAPFSNSLFFINSRNGATFGHIVVQSFRVYNRQLSAAEICMNTWTDYALFGGTVPKCL